jgi:hypothetical protein
MSEHSVIVWDLETVPDLAAAMRLLASIEQRTEMAGIPAAARARILERRFWWSRCWSIATGNEAPRLWRERLQAGASGHKDTLEEGLICVRRFGFGKQK